MLKGTVRHFISSPNVPGSLEKPRQNLNRSWPRNDYIGHAEGIVAGESGRRRQPRTITFEVRFEF
jgi:hypothetical protein